MNSKKLSRREFLNLSGAAAAGLVLAACAPAPTPAPTSAPAPPSAVAPTSAPAATSAPAPTQPPAPTAVPPAAKAASGHVVVMHNIKSGELSEKQTAQFQAKYPGITVELVETDLTRYFAMYAAGNPPDLVRVQAPSVPPYLARKMLYDLTPYFAASTELKADDLASANNYYKAEDPLHVGSGKTYGMCKDWSPDFTLFAFKKPFADKNIPLPDTTKPLTYQQVYDLGKQLASFQGDRVAMFGFDYSDVWVDRSWMNMLGETGDLLYSEDYSKINLSGNDKTKAILQYFFNHAKDKLGAVGSIIPSPNWIGDDFDKGLVGLIQYVYWFSAMAESDVTKDQVVFLPAPTWAGVKRDPTMTATGMVMAASTKVPDAAWQVFQWYNAEEPAQDRAGSGWGVPALKSFFAKMPNSGFQAQVQTVLQGELSLGTAPLQFNPYLGETTVPNTWMQYLAQAVTGSLTFDKMLANVETDVNAAIADGKAAIG
jgi:multiple sugar transport system substrate-binding protein